MGISYHVAGPVLKLCLSLWASGYIVALFNFRSHLQITYRSCFAIPAQAPVSVQTWATLEITSYANMHWESHSDNHLTAMLPISILIYLVRWGGELWAGSHCWGQMHPLGDSVRQTGSKHSLDLDKFRSLKQFWQVIFFVSVWKEADIGSSLFIAVNWLFVLNCSLKKSEYLTAVFWK